MWLPGVFALWTEALDLTMILLLSYIDPQVEFEGAKGSLFDYLEDLNCDECLSKAMKIAGVTGDLPACANMARTQPTALTGNEPNTHTT